MASSGVLHPVADVTGAGARAPGASSPAAMSAPSTEAAHHAKQTSTRGPKNKRKKAEADASEEQPASGSKNWVTCEALAAVCSYLAMSELRSQQALPAQKETCQDNYRTQCEDIKAVGKWNDALVVSVEESVTRRTGQQNANIQ